MESIVKVTDKVQASVYMSVEFKRELHNVSLNEQAIVKLSKFLKDCHINYSQVLLRQAVDDIVSQYAYVQELSNTDTAARSAWYDITPAESNTGEKVSIHLTNLADEGYRNLSQQIMLLIEIGLKEDKKTCSN